MWRYIKLAVFLVVIIAISKYLIREKLEQRADREIPQLVAQQQASLPRMINQQIVLESVSYDNRTLQYQGRSNTWFERSESDGRLLEQKILEHYCENMKVFVRSNVSLALNIQIPPKTLNDRMTSMSLDLHPADCAKTRDL